MHQQPVEVGLSGPNASVVVPVHQRIGCSGLRQPGCYSCEGGRPMVDFTALPVRRVPPDAMPAAPVAPAPPVGDVEMQ